MPPRLGPNGRVVKRQRNWSNYAIGPAHDEVSSPDDWDCGSRNPSFTAADMRAVERQARMGQSFALDWYRPGDLFTPDESEFVPCAFPDCENPRRPQMQAKYCIDHATTEMRAAEAYRRWTPPTLEERMAVVKVIKRRARERPRL